MTENFTTTTIVKFQKWLDVQARDYDKKAKANQQSQSEHRHQLFCCDTTKTSARSTESNQSEPTPKERIEQLKVYNSSSKKVQQLANKYRKCVECQKQHFLAACPDHWKLSPDDRF